MTALYSMPELPKIVKEANTDKLMDNFMDLIMQFKR